jgi:hypothetical protein
MSGTRPKLLITLASLLGLTGVALGALGGCAHRVSAPAGPAWSYFFDGQEAKLAYGRANSDEVGLMMTCTPHSGSVLVSGAATPDKPRLILASGKTVSTLAGTAQDDPLSGSTVVEARARLRDAAISNFARTGRLTLVRDGRPIDMPASSGDRDSVRRFFSACA